MTHPTIDIRRERHTRHRRTQRSPQANRRRRWSLESLEDRVVLSMVDLTQVGLSGTITQNGVAAVYRQGQTQPSGSGNIQSFVRIQQDGQEQGYNTDARGGPGSSYADPVNSDVNTTATFDRSL